MTPRDKVLVDGRSWVEILSSCCGHGGVAGTFSLPLTCVIPHADSCTILCAVRQRHRYKFDFLSVMAGDCGDEIPSKSKPQPAGVTSCTNFENVLHFRCFSLQLVLKFQFSIFVTEVFKSAYIVLLHFLQILRIFLDSLLKPCMLLIMRHCIR